MGIWERSPAGSEISMRNQGLLEDFRRALPDFAVEDNVGSPYCVLRYVVDEHLGAVPRDSQLHEAYSVNAGCVLSLTLFPTTWHRTTHGFSRILNISSGGTKKILREIRHPSSRPAETFSPVAGILTFRRGLTCYSSKPFSRVSGRRWSRRSRRSPNSATVSGATWRCSC